MPNKETSNINATTTITKITTTKKISTMTTLKTTMTTTSKHSLSTKTTPISNTKCSLLMPFFQKYKNISQLLAKWLLFLKVGVSFFSGNSGGTSKNSLIITQTLSSTNKKFITIPTINYPSIKSILSSEVVKFVATKINPFIPIFVITHTAKNVGNLISKLPFNQEILFFDAWVVNARFSYKQFSVYYKNFLRIKGVSLIFIKNLYVSNFLQYIETTNFVLESTVAIVSKFIIWILEVSNVHVEKFFVSNANPMITVLVPVNKNPNGWKMYSSKRLMRNGCQSTPNFVLGVKKPFNEVLDVTLWPVFVERTFVIYVQDHGNRITRTTLNVTFTKKVPHNK